MTSALLSPFKIGQLTLANRVVMAPLTRGRAGATRVPNSYMAEYYATRASAGLIISEATAISEEGFGWYGAPGIYTDEQAKAWKSVTDAVHAKGGKIFLQLWHMGRQAHSSFNNGKQVVAPSAIAIPAEAQTTHDANNQRVNYELPRALETEEIPRVVADYRHGAKLAKEAGFDGVEIHGANGYLIDEFLQSVSNHRTDKYGGSIENRYRFLKEVVEAVGKEWSYDQIGLRLSPNGVYGAMGSSDNYETFCFVMSQLSQYGLAYLHVMDGLGFGFHNKDRQVTAFDAKVHFKGPVIINVGLDKATAEGALRTGAADLIAFGRLYISNPDLVERFTNDWPLNPSPGYDVWYGSTPDPKDSLRGYLTYTAYNKDDDKAKAN